MKTLIKIYAIALPILASSLVGLIALFINLGILGRENSFNLYIMGIYLPIGFIVLSFIESLRVSSIAFSSQASGSKDYNLLKERLLTLISVAVLIFIILSILFLIIKFPFMDAYNVNQADQPLIARFIQYNLLSSILVITSMLLMSSLYGLGYTLSVTLVTIISFAANVALTYYFVVKMKLGIFSIIYATLITSSITILIAIRWLVNIKVFSRIEVRKIAVVPALFRIRNISLPVLLGYGIMFIHIVLFNKILVLFGSDEIAGFSVSNRLQNIALMPAISIGISIAIHVNRLRSNNQAHESSAYIRTGIYSTFMLYLLIAVLIFMSRETLLSLITNDINVIKASSKYLYYIGPSYFVLGPLLMLLIFFEQTGKGIRSLIFNAVSFALQLSVAFYVAYKFNSVILVYKVMAVGYMLTFFYIIYEVRRSALYYGVNEVSQASTSGETNEI